MCACVRACVSQWKKVPDEWQARQATPAILQVSSSMHNAKKITTRERGPFHQSITAILTEEKREEKQLLNLHMLLCVCLCVEGGDCVHEQQEETRTGNRFWCMIHFLNVFEDRLTVVKHRPTQPISSFVCLWFTSQKLLHHNPRGKILAKVHAEQLNLLLGNLLHHVVRENWQNCLQSDQPKLNFLFEVDVEECPTFLRQKRKKHVPWTK